MRHNRRRCASTPSGTGRGGSGVAGTGVLASDKGDVLTDDDFGIFIV